MTSGECVLVAIIIVAVCVSYCCGMTWPANWIMGW